MHVAARASPYRGGPDRFPVPDELVPLHVAFPEYAPPTYTAAGKWHEDISDLRLARWKVAGIWTNYLISLQ